MTNFLTLFFLIIFLPIKLWSYCSAPSAPFGGPPTKPSPPYCVNTFTNTHNCSNWEIDSYNNEIRNYQNEVEYFVNDLRSYLNKAQDYVNCEITNLE